MKKPSICFAESSTNGIDGWTAHKTPFKSIFNEQTLSESEVVMRAPISVPKMIGPTILTRFVGYAFRPIDRSRLELLFLICSHGAMEHRLTPQAFADTILNAPGWAKVGITMPNRGTREAAAEALALSIADKLGIELAERDERTIPLPL